MDKAKVYGKAIGAAAVLIAWAVAEFAGIDVPEAVVVAVVTAVVYAIPNAELPDDYELPPPPSTPGERL